MAQQTPKPPRPMHWNVWPSGETACGKNSIRVRCTDNLKNWDNPRLADGRRCPKCKANVDARRAQGEV